MIPSNSKQSRAQASAAKIKAKHFNSALAVEVAAQRKENNRLQMQKVKLLKQIQVQDFQIATMSHKERKTMLFLKDINTLYSMKTDPPDDSNRTSVTGVRPRVSVPKRLTSASSLARDMKTLQPVYEDPVPDEASTGRGSEDPSPTKAMASDGGALRPRRSPNVTINYKEPSVNCKIRRGDPVFKSEKTRKSKPKNEPKKKANPKAFVSLL